MEEQLIDREKLLEFKPKESITAICEGRVVSICTTSITHVSKYGKETVIYTTTHRYKTYHSLQEIANDLPVNEFYRVHRSHIVALGAVNEVWKGRISVNNYYLPFSRGYKKVLANKFALLLDKHFNFFEEP